MDRTYYKKMRFLKRVNIQIFFVFIQIHPITRHLTYFNTSPIFIWTLFNINLLPIADLRHKERLALVNKQSILANI